MVSKATGATPQGQRGCCAYEEQLTSRTSCSVTVRLAESAGSQLLLQRPCPTCATSRTSTTMSIPTLRRCARRGRYQTLCSPPRPRSCGTSSSGIRSGRRRRGGARRQRRRHQCGMVSLSTVYGSNRRLREFGGGGAGASGRGRRGGGAARELARCHRSLGQQQKSQLDGEMPTAF
jgi:hypothetical protein